MKKTTRYIPYSELRKELLSDPETKAAYEALKPEYQLIRASIDRRLAKEISQKQLADKIGTKQSAISRLESGKANPSLKFLKKVAKALDSKLVIEFR